MEPTHHYFLLADDDPEDREMFSYALDKFKLDVKLEMAGNGLQAMDILGNTAGQLPCLILLDFKMPVMGAPEVLDQLRSNEKYRDIPAVVWSSSGQQQHIKGCVEKGAKRYFVKPNSVEELITAVGEIIQLCTHNRQSK